MPETKLAKKAAKKVASKAAKKVAKKAAKKTPKGPGHDARRAYEHLHRIGILQGQLSGEVRAQLNTLSTFAQAAFAQEDAKSAAELLRAGEHLAFGSLAEESSSDAVSEPLKLEIAEEFEDLVQRAAEHWDRHTDMAPSRELKAIYKAMLAEAKTARKNKAFHRALEFARGAGALAKAHVVNLRLEPPGPRSSRVLPGRQI